jgi:hypothetical protein
MDLHQAGGYQDRSKRKLKAAGPHLQRSVRHFEATISSSKRWRSITVALMTHRSFMHNNQLFVSRT